MIAAIVDEPVELKEGTCPIIAPGTIGTCALQCITDLDCSGGQKCVII